MSVFTPSPSPTLETRVAALETLLAALNGNVDQNATAAADALAVVSGARQSGDAALTTALTQEQNARIAGDQANANALGQEIVARAQGDQLNLTALQLAEAKVFALRDSIAARVFEAWTALEATPLPQPWDGLPFMVLDSDEDEHSDPITAATVRNGGIYLPVEQATPLPSGWKRVADTTAYAAGLARELAQAWAAQESGEVDPAYPGLSSARAYAVLAAADREAVDAIAAFWGTLFVTEVADDDVVAQVDQAGRKSFSTNGDGTYQASFLRGRWMKYFAAELARVVVTDGTGKPVGSIERSKSDPRLIETDGAGSILRRVLADGTMLIPLLESVRGKIGTLRTGEVAFEDAMGVSAGSIARNPFSVFPAVADPAGRILDARGADGALQRPDYGGASRFAGSMLGGNAEYSLHSARRIDGGHDVWLVRNDGGGRRRVSQEGSTADHLNPAIVSVPTGHYVVYTKRTGRAVELRGVKIGGDGSEVPYESTPAQVCAGDSYTHQDNLNSVATEHDRKVGRYQLFGSGGSNPLADFAALAGGTVTVGQSGNNPTRNDGSTAQTSYTDDGSYRTYPALTKWQDRTIIFTQGQNEEVGNVAALIDGYISVLNWMTPVHKRMLIIEWAPAADWTQAQVDALRADWAALKAHPIVGPHCVDMWDFMRANGGGGTVGSAGGEVWALGNYALPGDAIHMAPLVGGVNYGRGIANGLNARGF
ncbi:MAG: hypothetical protein CVT77_06495 [Alphaproteobacteria bacterium HGW-Alphaproteobacteria-16]|nr:MAG: hypothetical protein CVT77_06495 [Alphaproteobacteria bacterium HGW-Alphaproteobacteria-16]